MARLGDPGNRRRTNRRTESARDRFEREQARQTAIRNAIGMNLSDFPDIQPVAGLTLGKGMGHGGLFDNLSDFLQEDIYDPISDLSESIQEEIYDPFTDLLEEIAGESVEDVAGDGLPGWTEILDDPAGFIDPFDDDEEEDEGLQLPPELPPDGGTGGIGGVRGFGGDESEFEISEGISPYRKGDLYGPQALRPYDFSAGNPMGNMYMPQNQMGMGTVDPAIQNSVMMTGRGGGISPFAAGNAWGQRRTGRGFY